MKKVSQPKLFDEQLSLQTEIAPVEDAVVVSPAEADSESKTQKKAPAKAQKKAPAKTQKKAEKITSAKAKAPVKEKGPAKVETSVKAKAAAKAKAPAKAPAKAAAKAKTQDTEKAAAADDLAEYEAATEKLIADDAAAANEAAEDAAAEAEDAAAADEDESEFPAPDPAQQQRLQKIMAQAGVASRRKAEELITGGHVVVNGQVVTELGSKADPARDHIRVDGKLLHGPERLRYFVLNKPRGFVTTVSDPEGRPTVMQFFERTGERLYPVGRLDYLSEGLLLVTNDGQLANKLTRAASGVEKTYLVKVAGEPTEEMLELLRGGVMIARGRPDPNRPYASVDKVRTAPAYVQKVREGDNPWFEVVLIEGRNRELRKMFEEIGHHVEKIRRVGYGPLVLDVEPGKLRELEAAEIEALRATAEGKFKPKRRKVGALIPKEPARSKRPASRPAQGMGTPVRSLHPRSTGAAEARPASAAGSKFGKSPSKPWSKPRLESGARSESTSNSRPERTGAGRSQSGPARTGSNFSSNRTDFSRARPAGPGRTGGLRSNSNPRFAAEGAGASSGEGGFVRPGSTGTEPTRVNSGPSSRPSAGRTGSDRFSKPAESGGYRPAKFAFSKPASEKHGAAPTWKSKTGAAKPAWNKSATEGRSDRPARAFNSDAPSARKPAFGRSDAPRPAFNKAGSDRPRFGKPAFGQSGSGQSGFDRSGSDRPRLDRPKSDRPSFDRSGSKPPSDRPFAVKSPAGRDGKPAGRSFGARSKPAFDRAPKVHRPDFDDEPMRPRVKLHIEEIKETAPSRAVRTATRAAARSSAAPQREGGKRFEPATGAGDSRSGHSSGDKKSGGGWKPKSSFGRPARPSGSGSGPGAKSGTKLGAKSGSKSGFKPTGSSRPKPSGRPAGKKRS